MRATIDASFRLAVVPLLFKGQEKRRFTTIGKMRKIKKEKKGKVDFPSLLPSS
jgi:hypothetical protein